MVTVREVEGVKNHLIFFSRSQTAKKHPTLITPTTWQPSVSIYALSQSRMRSVEKKELQTMLLIFMLLRSLSFFWQPRAWLNTNNFAGIIYRHKKLQKSQSVLLLPSRHLTFRCANIQQLSLICSVVRMSRCDNVSCAKKLEATAEIGI